MIRWSNITRTHEEQLEWKRSGVRRLVTYGAASFAFAGGGLLMVLAFIEPWLNEAYKTVNLDIGAAKDIYLSILPTAIGIIGYWFGNRKPKEGQPTNRLETKEPAIEDGKHANEHEGKTKD